MKLEMSQKLGLNQSLQTSLQVLQLNTLQLREYLHETLLDNAMVDMEFPLFDPASDPFRNRFKSGKTSFSGQGENEDTTPQIKANENTVLDDLLLQCSLLKPSESDRRLLHYLIHSLNSDGFLTESPEEIAHIHDVDRECVLRCISLLQTFEPAGIGARTLSECLHLQLIREIPVDTTAVRIVDDYLEEMAAKRYLHIAKAMDVAKTEVIRACEHIQTLSPRPVNGLYDEASVNYIFPDFYVTEEDGNLHYSMNDYYLPHIRLHPEYVSLLKSKQLSQSDHAYLMRDYEKAGQTLRFLEYRKTTLQQIIELILIYQRGFFLYGPGHARPLQFRELAEALSLHESTISRAVAEKHFKCKWGVYSLRSLFQHSMGENADTSPDHIQTLIRDLIEKEPPEQPYSDQTICDLLEKQNIRLARRTVAKYRGLLGIPTTGKRKKKNL